jgi:hypothetical protein
MGGTPHSSRKHAACTVLDVYSMIPNFVLYELTSADGLTLTGHKIFKY